MTTALTDGEAAARRAKILAAARWCFLNFGFAKTSFQDIAERADLSRTLLYRLFDDKEAIYRAVFEDWLLSRHGAAKKASTARGSARERLIQVSWLMVVEPWGEMVGTPMGAEFLDACSRIDPDIDAKHRRVLLECVREILGDKASAEVYLLALDGLLADDPSTEVLEKRTDLLAARFAAKGSRA
jgi:AcrR family transcriptional regulator